MKEAYNQGRIHNSQQDGSQEFISLLTYVYVDGTITPLALIYKGALNDL
jgi:hypothetical protein